MTFAQSSIREPLHRGYIETTIHKQLNFVPVLDASDRDPLIHLWEFPQPNTHYFAGVDTARGEDLKKFLDPDAKVSPGDYCAVVVWNGETGAMAASYMARVSPEKLSVVASELGRYYNDAVLNVELNNLGYVVMKELRDRWFYPNQHTWKGRDDRIQGGKPGVALGFDTTERTRKQMFSTFRVALYRKEVTPRSAEFVRQMGLAQMETAFRWAILVGHDDLFLAGLLGWIGREQVHPAPCKSSPARNLLLTREELEMANLALTGKGLPMVDFGSDPSTTAAGSLMLNANDHLRFIARYEKKQKMPDRLQGI